MGISSHTKLAVLLEAGADVTIYQDRDPMIYAIEEGSVS